MEPDYPDGNMADFEDKRGRTIQIDADECAYAYHNGKQIGFVETTGPREIDPRVADLPPQITGWEVDEPYRRRHLRGDGPPALRAVGHDGAGREERWGRRCERADRRWLGDHKALPEAWYIGEFEDELPPRAQEYEAFWPLFAQTSGGMKRPNAKCESGHWRLVRMHREFGDRIGGLHLASRRRQRE